MAIKTFNVDAEVHRQFASFCREHGISMSRQIEMFMQHQLEANPVTKKEHAEKLERMSLCSRKREKDFGII